MIIEVISTGTELMRGNSIDTNFSYTARSILSLGIEVRYRSTCGDELSDIIESIKTACRRANIVILTGGLGPTADDLTRNAAAEAFDVPLIFNKKDACVHNANLYADIYKDLLQNKLVSLNS